MTLQQALTLMMIAILLSVQTLALDPNVTTKMPASTEVLQVTVSGNILVPKNTKSPLAIVELRNVNGRTTHVSVKTDAKGDYTLKASVPEGWYKLFVGSPACLPVASAMYVDKSANVGLDVSLKQYTLKKAPIRFIPVYPTSTFHGKATVAVESQGCWNAKAVCAPVMHYQVVGDAIDGRTHCPSGFIDFLLDEGGDCIGIYKCTGDSADLQYCPDVSPSSRGTESVVYTDPAANRRHAVFTAVATLKDSLTTLRNNLQLDAWYKTANDQMSKTVELRQSETDGPTKALYDWCIIALAEVVHIVKKDTTDHRVLMTTDESMLRYPSTWALYGEMALSSYTLFSPPTRVQQHFEALESANVVDDESIAVVLAYLTDTYDKRKDAVAARNFERLLNDKYSKTSIAQEYAEHKRKNMQLVGHQAKTIRGLTPQGAEAALEFPMSPPRLVLLDFWATWCRPCIIEIDHMLTLIDSIRARGIEIIGIAINDDANKVIDFRKRKAIPWQTVMLPKAITPEILEAYNANSIPQLVLIAPDGKVIAAGAALRGQTMLETIDAALRAQKP